MSDYEIVKYEPELPGQPSEPALPEGAFYGFCAGGKLYHLDLGLQVIQTSAVAGSPALLAFVDHFTAVLGCCGARLEARHCCDHGLLMLATNPAAERLAQCYSTLRKLAREVQAHRCE